jgi:hypothetical protein
MVETTRTAERGGTPIEAAVNIGPALAGDIRRAGIATVEDLVALGDVAA